RLSSAALTLDGRPVAEDATEEGDALLWTLPAGLAEGPHRLNVVVPRWGPLGEASQSLTFTIDRQPPVVELAPVPPTAIDAAVVLAGRTEPGATAQLDEHRATVAADGRFELALPRPPAGVVDLVATDPAGNAVATPLRVPVLYPHTRGVHVTGA